MPTMKPIELAISKALLREERKRQQGIGHDRFNVKDARERQHAQERDREHADGSLSQKRAAEA
jgi:hypothetical protein